MPSEGRNARRGAHANPCPRCATPMVGYELRGIEIDQCLTCAGTWLDTGEIEMLAELEQVDPSRTAQALGRGRPGSRRETRCPRCRRRLRAVVFDAGATPIEIDAGATPIEIDRCDRRCGYFFDPGELASFLRTLDAGAAGPAGVVASFLRDLYRDRINPNQGG